MGFLFKLTENSQFTPKNIFAISMLPLGLPHVAILEKALFSYTNKKIKKNYDICF